MGAVWSDFTPVKQAWEETFGSKPYTTHTLAIAGAPLHLPNSTPTESCFHACARLASLNQHATTHAELRHDSTCLSSVAARAVRKKGRCDVLQT